MTEIICVLVGMVLAWLFGILILKGMIEKAAWALGFPILMFTLLPWGNLKDSSIDPIYVEQSSRTQQGWGECPNCGESDLFSPCSSCQTPLTY